MRATAEMFALAEGPLWDAARSRLLWVDILAGEVLEGELDGQRVDVTARHRFDGTVGALAVAPNGSPMVAAQEHLVLQRSDGTRRSGPRLVPSDEGRRADDGSTDPAGRFLVGTLRMDGLSDREVLVRFEPDGSLTRLDGDLTLSNGLAAEDHLWVAVQGVGEVRRYGPDGAVDRVVLPAPHTTSVAFAGEDLRTLVLTTAHGELSEEQRRAHPESGRLSTARVDVPDVPGVPVPQSTRSAAC